MRSSAEGASFDRHQSARDDPRGAGPCLSSASGRPIWSVRRTSRGNGLCRPRAGDRPEPRLGTQTQRVLGRGFPRAQVANRANNAGPSLLRMSCRALPRGRRSVAADRLHPGYSVVVDLAEEDPVALLGDLGEIDCLGTAGRVEMVCSCATAPFDVGVCLYESHLERLRCIAERTTLLSPEPANVEGYIPR